MKKPLTYFLVFFLLSFILCLQGSFAQNTKNDTANSATLSQIIERLLKGMRSNMNRNSGDNLGGLASSKSEETVFVKKKSLLELTSGGRDSVSLIYNSDPCMGTFKYAECKNDLYIDCAKYFSENNLVHKDCSQFTKQKLQNYFILPLSERPQYSSLYSTPAATGASGDSDTQMQSPFFNADPADTYIPGRPLPPEVANRPAPPDQIYTSTFNGNLKEISGKASVYWCSRTGNTGMSRTLTAKYGCSTAFQIDADSPNYCGVAIAWQTIRDLFGHDRKEEVKNQPLEIRLLPNSRGIIGGDARRCVVAPIQDSFSPTKNSGIRYHNGSGAVIDLSSCVMKKLAGSATGQLNLVDVKFRLLRQGEQGCQK
jgi:hypothetical protein